MEKLDQTAWYRIAAKTSGKVITVEEAAMENGAFLCLTEENGADHQLWSLIPVGENQYKLVNKATGKALDVMQLGTENGTLLHQWDDVDAESQKWTLEQRENSVSIHSVLSGKCIDVVEMAADAEGAHLQLWDDVDGDNQKWVLTAVGAVQEAPAEAPKAEVISTEEPAKPQRKTTRTRRTTKKSSSGTSKRTRRTTKKSNATRASQTAETKE